MKAKYIDKTFPITLQDLIDLAKSENLDPKDLKLIMNSNQADLSAYVQCALLNQDCDKISIELYTEANDGLHEDISLKTKPKSPLKQNKIHKYQSEEYLKDVKALVENMESDGLSDTTITSILKQGSKGYI
jgi:hypothetical protein